MAQGDNIPAVLIGAWTRVNGDYPLTRIFRADGTFVSLVFGFDESPSPFRIESDVMVFPVEQPDGSIYEQKERFKLSGDSLTFFDIEDDEIPPAIYRRDPAP